MTGPSDKALQLAAQFPKLLEECSMHLSEAVQAVRQRDGELERLSERANIPKPSKSISRPNLKSHLAALRSACEEIGLAWRMWRPVADRDPATQRIDEAKIRKLLRKHVANLLWIDSTPQEYVLDENDLKRIDQAQKYSSQLNELAGEARLAMSLLLNDEANWNRKLAARWVDLKEQWSRVPPTTWRATLRNGVVTDLKMGEDHRQLVTSLAGMAGKLLAAMPGTDCPDACDDASRWFLAVRKIAGADVREEWLDGVESLKGMPYETVLIGFCDIRNAEVHSRLLITDILAELPHGWVSSTVEIRQQRPEPATTSHPASFLVDQLTAGTDRVVDPPKPTGHRKAKRLKFSSYRAPADWRQILEKQHQPHTESAWRRFRDAHHAEKHPASKNRLWRFPLADLEQAGILVPEATQED